MAIFYISHAGSTSQTNSVFLSPVGIAEISGLPFNIFPNPWNNMLYIQTISKGGETLNIELLDLIGRKLKTIFNGITTTFFKIFKLIKIIFKYRFYI